MLVPFRVLGGVDTATTTSSSSLVLTGERNTGGFYRDTGRSKWYMRGWVAFLDIQALQKRFPYSCSGLF